MLDIKGNERFCPFDRMEAKSISIDESYPQKRFYKKQSMEKHQKECNTNKAGISIDRDKLNERLNRLKDQEQVLVNEIQKFKENSRDMKREKSMEARANRGQTGKDIPSIGPHVCMKGKHRTSESVKTTMPDNNNDESITMNRKEHRKKAVTRSNSSGIVNSWKKDGWGDIGGKNRPNLRFSQEEICNSKPSRQCKQILSKSSDDINDLLALRQEKVVLVQKLGYLEDKAQEIQSNVKKINWEKDQLNELYNKSREEINRLKSELHQSKTQNSSNPIKVKECCSGSNVFETTSKLNATIRQIESEKEKAIFNLSRVSAERDSVISKYKLEPQTNSIWFYQRRIESLNSEKSRLQDECDKKQNRIQSYIKELNDHHVKITKLERMLANEKVEHKRRQMEIHQMNESRTENQSKLDETYRDLVSTKQTYLDLKTQYEIISNEKINMERELSSLKNDLNKTNNSLRNVDKKFAQISRDHDQLLTENGSLITENKDLHEKLKEFNQRYNHISTEYSKITKNEEILKRQVEEYEKKVEENEQNIEELEKRYQKEHGDLEYIEEKLRNEEKERQKLVVLERKRVNDYQKLRRTLELANKDKKSLENYIDELKRANQKLNDLKVYHEEELKNRTVRERNLEELVNQLEFDLKKRVEELNYEKESKMEALNHRDSLRARYDKLEKEYVNIQDQLKMYEKNINQLDNACKKLSGQQERDTAKMKEMKTSYQRLESDKRNFENLYRQSQEKLAASEASIKQLNNAIIETKSQVAMLERNSEIYLAQVAEKACELNTCQSELNELKKFINESRLCMDSTERDLNRFREEAHRLSQENAKLASDLNEQIRIRNDLEKNINEHVSSMPKLQKTLEEMNNERCVLSEQLQDAFEELKNWRFRWENCDKECNFFKSECDQIKGDFLRERDKNEILERDLIQIKSSLTSAEMQITSLNKITNDSQEKNREYQIEVEHMVAEVNRLRESIKKTNSMKSNLESDLINKQIEVDQMKSHIDELELMLQEQKDLLYQEKNQNRSLLKSLESDKEKICSCEKLLKDSNKEILIMRDRLEDFKQKNASLNKELGKMRMIFMEAERETNRLSKSLALEKCEKERLISEARMNSLPSEYKPSGYLSSYMQSKNIEDDKLEESR